MRLLLSVLFVSGWAMAASAQDRIVTSEAELRSAIASARPGDSIVMADGVWDDVLILFEAEGLPGDTITLRAETPGKVLLTGGSSLRIAGSYLKVDGLFFTGGFLTGGHVIQFRKDSRTVAHHSRLTNTAVVDYNPPSRLTEYKWVSLYGTHNRVDHSHFEGKTHDGATLVVWLADEPNYHRIDHNYFGRRPDLGKNGGETIRIGTSDWSLHSSQSLVEHNLFHRCDGEIEIISNKSGDNVYRYNTFLESAGTLTLRHGDRARVESNFFLGNNKSNSGGVRIIGEDHVVVNNYFEKLKGSGYRAPISIVNGVPDSPLNEYFPVKRALVAHNTIVNSYTAFEIGSGAGSRQSVPPESVVVANNIVSNVETPRGNLISMRSQPVAMTWSANLMHGSSLGVSNPGGIDTADPQLESSTSGVMRPAASSPAVGAADLSFSPVQDDVIGRIRPEETRTIGAYEVDSSGGGRRPLTPSDVGVSFSTSTAVQRAGLPPEGMSLEVFPNPFTDNARAVLHLDRALHVRLELFDAIGRSVAVLVDRVLPAGPALVQIAPGELAAGAYFVALTTDGRRITRSLSKVQ